MMRKMLLPLLLLSAFSVSARPVAITGEDGTTRLVDVPAAGTNWIGVVGVDFAGNIVTNEALWARRHDAKNSGTIEWADGTRSHFRLPKEGKTVAVSHEIKVLGKGNKRTRLVEVLWIDRDGKMVSNAIGRAAQVLPYRPQFDKARKEREDKALAAAKRHPNPDPEDFRYISSHRRSRRPKGVSASGKPRPNPAPKKRDEPKEPGEDADKILDEYRAKAKAAPSRVEKRPGK